MAARLTFDPALESCPDYTSPSYKILHDALQSLTAGLSEADTVTELVTIWNTDLDGRKAAWADQIQADADAEAAATAAAEAVVEQEHLAREAEQLIKLRYLDIYRE
ncbi:hypothetical protein B0H10DRAFT_2214641 [Mycena sp. CBHHK59/15]|nr:hypothetical protein B0H10DRAFT_2214641 [Mycena sp. CBHHK59/15]